MVWSSRDQNQEAGRQLACQLFILTFRVIARGGLARKSERCEPPPSIASFPVDGIGILVLFFFPPRKKNFLIDSPSGMAVVFVCYCYPRYSILLHPLKQGSGS